MKNLIFWYQKIIYWYKKFKFLRSENEILISKNDLYFLISENRFFFISENKTHIILWYYECSLWCNPQFDANLYIDLCIMANSSISTMVSTALSAIHCELNGVDPESTSPFSKQQLPVVMACWMFLNMSRSTVSLSAIFQITLPCLGFKIF